MHAHDRVVANAANQPGLLAIMRAAMVVIDHTVGDENLARIAGRSSQHAK
jgi:hypothetical protein